MKLLKTLSIVATMTGLSLAIQPAWAAEGHQDGEAAHQAAAMTEHHDMQNNHDKMNMDMEKKQGMFMVKKEVDGYTVSFHVMAAKKGMQHGGSHNLMIKVEKDGATLTNIAVNSKVFYANKTSDSKMLMKMGDWFMAGYDLKTAGKHGIMVLFKTTDGKKHKVSTYYPEAKSS